jgi:hypothetical protein
MNCSVKIALVSIGTFFALASPHVSGLGTPTTSWAAENAKGHFPYHRLVASDFPINDKAHPKYAMHTNGFFQFYYHEHWIENNGHAVARITDWTVWSGFDRNKSSRKSWFKEVDRLLPHEQRHLDINELFSKRLADMPIDKLPIGEGNTGPEAEADLKRKMDALSDRIGAEEKVEQDRYDAETNHGANAAKQREWSASIQARLQKAGIHF